MKLDKTFWTNSTFFRERDMTTADDRKDVEEIREGRQINQNIGSGVHKCISGLKMHSAILIRILDRFYLGIWIWILDRSSLIVSTELNSDTDPGPPYLVCQIMILNHIFFGRRIRTPNHLFFWCRMRIYDRFFLEYRILNLDCFFLRCRI